MSAGKRLVLSVLWLAALGGGLWSYTFFVRGEDADKVAQDFEVAWETSIAQGVDGPELAEFVKKVPGKDRGTVEERLKKIEQEKEGKLAKGLLAKVPQEFDAAWDTAIDTGTDGPDVGKTLEKVPAKERPAVEQRLKQITQEKESKFSRIPLAIDDFSGYCIFRSPQFHQRLKKKGIYVHLINDGADYQERIKALDEGKTKLAVYTIDALINTSMLRPTPPASIVFVIDESKGADAILAFKNVLKDKDALNQKDVKIVFTKDSPSETLARAVLSKFSPLLIPKANLIRAKDIDEVKDQLKNAKDTDKTAFVLWEPEITKMKGQRPGLQVIASSKEDDYLGKIVDVFVAEKKFLAANRDKVKTIIEAYFQTLEEFEKNKGMVQFVIDDAKRTGSEMSRQEAVAVVDGIGWRSAKINYAQFGIDDTLKMTSVAEMIADLTKLLIGTGAISRGPDPNTLFDKTPLRELAAVNFGATAAAGPPTKKLDEQGWAKLRPLNKFELENITFSGASPEFNQDLAGPSLTEAAKIMKDYPAFYLEIRGYLRRDSDSPEDKDLKQKRAAGVAAALVAKGVAADRIRAVPAKMGVAKEDKVSFIMLEKAAE